LCITENGKEIVDDTRIRISIRDDIRNIFNHMESFRYLEIKHKHSIYGDHRFYAGLGFNCYNIANPDIILQPAMYIDIIDIENKISEEKLEFKFSMMCDVWSKNIED